jgi:hypothetical protein
MKPAIAVIIVIVLLFIYQRLKYSPVYVGLRNWNVVGSYQNNKDAAQLLDRTHNNLLIFMRYLEKKYHIDETDDVINFEDPTIHNISKSYRGKVVESLLKKYNPDVFYENDPKYSSNTSYTVNKGDRMYICLRNKENNNQLVDPDVLMFTMLHEMSHIANFNGWGHQKQFWEVFKFILWEATNSGVYKPVNYKEYPVNFCGLRITYNPLYDNKTEMIS